MTTAAEIAAARAAILEQITAGKGLVEYEVGGRRYSYSPQLAMLAIERLEKQIATSTPMSSRRRRAGFRR